MAQDGGKVVSLKHRPLLPQEILLVLISVRGSQVYVTLLINKSAIKSTCARNEDKRGGGGIGPFTLNHDTRWCGWSASHLGYFVPKNIPR